MCCCVCLRLVCSDQMLVCVLRYWVEGSCHRLLVGVSVAGDCLGRRSRRISRGTLWWCVMVRFAR